MFSFIDSSIEQTAINNSEKEDLTVSLEAFQGDLALIQTVNELNHLKHSTADVTPI